MTSRCRKAPVTISSPDVGAMVTPPRQHLRMVANPIAAFFNELCAPTPPTAPTPGKLARRRGLQRAMHPFRPLIETHLDDLRRRRGRVPMQASIYRERGLLMRGQGLPTIVLGGFVPDATEALHCQRRLLRRFGDLYYVNYPLTGCDREALFAQLRDLVAHLAARDERPVLLGISFGCALLGEFLAADRRLRERVGGLVLVSPVLSVEDLAGEGKGDCSLVGRICMPMLDARDGEEAEASVRQSRRFFGKLFLAGSQNQRAMRRLRWRKQGEFLKEKILETVREISSQGARQRLALLRRTCPLRAGEWARPLFGGPALALFAEEENAVLAPRAPVRQLLTEPLHDVLPRGAAAVIKANDPEDRVQHASLIFHSTYFNPPLRSFYERLSAEIRPVRSLPNLRTGSSLPLLRSLRSLRPPRPVRALQALGVEDAVARGGGPR